MELLRGFILQTGGIRSKMLCYKWYLVYHILQELDGWISQDNFRLHGVAAVVSYHQTRPKQYSQMFALWYFGRWDIQTLSWLLRYQKLRHVEAFGLWPLEYIFTGFCHYWYSTVTRTIMTKNKLKITKFKLGLKNN